MIEGIVEVGRAMPVESVTRQAELLHRHVPQSPEQLLPCIEKVLAGSEVQRNELMARSSEGRDLLSSGLKGAVAEAAADEALARIGRVEVLNPSNQEGFRSADRLIHIEKAAKIGGQELANGTRIVVEYKHVGQENILREIRSAIEQVEQSIAREGASIGFVLIPRECQFQAYTERFYELRAEHRTRNVHIVRLLPHAGAIRQAVALHVGGA